MSIYNRLTIDTVALSDHRRDVALRGIKARRDIEVSRGTMRGTQVNEVELTEDAETFLRQNDSEDLMSPLSQFARAGFLAGLRYHDQVRHLAA